MRRIVIIVAIVFIAVVLVGAAWLGSRMWAQRQHPSPSLNVLVNKQREVTVVQGSPLVFTISMTGSKHKPEVRIGSPGHPWYSNMSLTSAKNKQPLPWKVVLLSPPQSTSYHRDASGRVTFDTLGGDEALVSPAQLYSMDIAISPEETSRIPEGRYTVAAVLSPSFWPPWRWTGRVISRPVAITVVKRSENAALNDSLDRKRLVSSIEFYLQTQQFDKAYALALQFQNREPNTIYSFLLLGDALNGLRRDQEALHAYDQALHLAFVKDSYEAPEYLLMRKHEVEQRLERR